MCVLGELVEGGLGGEFTPSGSPLEQACGGEAPAGPTGTATEDLGATGRKAQEEKRGKQAVPPSQALDAAWGQRRSWSRFISLGAPHSTGGGALPTSSLGSWRWASALTQQVLRGCRAPGHPS